MTAPPKGSGRFVSVGPVEAFRDGRGRLVRIEGHEIAVFRRGDRFHAFGDRCAHMGASLAGGRLVGECVECPWHGWRYELATGRSDRKPWASVPVYETRIEGGQLYVAIPEASPQAPGGAPD